MARQEIVTVIDDLDGSEGATTVRFAFGDQSYEIDLNEQHTEELRAALDPYITAGRRLSRSGRPYVRIDLDASRRAHRREASSR